MAEYDQIQLDKDGLYILLADIQTPGLFDWSLYLHQSPVNGEIFQAVNTQSTNGRWIFESRFTQHITSEVSLLVALKIAVIEDVLKPLLRRRIQRTPVVEGLTCRTWVMAVMRVLDDEGVICIKRSSNVEDIEVEAQDLARDMEIFKTVAVRESEHCIL